MIKEDPITKVYKALWSLLEDWPGFVDRVRLGNRIKLTEYEAGDEPYKPNVSTADLPEVRLVPAGQTPHVQRTSNTSTSGYRFSVIVSTGSKGVDPLFPLEWEVFRAMSRWFEVLSTLTWNDSPFIVLGRPLTVDEGFAESDIARGIQGWASIWSCEITMKFSTADLQNKEI